MVEQEEIRVQLDWVQSFLYDNDQLLTFAAEFGGKLTNNQAEYMALILGLKTAVKEKISELEVFMDSELVVKQLNGEYRVKDLEMQQLKAQVDELLEDFNKISFTHVRREKNKHADRLVNLILDAKLNEKS